MLHKRADGTYEFTRRFWVTVIIASVLICAIGYSTQRTANRTDALSAETRVYANQTNQCLADVVNVLTTRVGYNEKIDKLDERRRELDARRQAVWEQLVADLSKANNDRGLNMDALAKFEQANTALKRDQAAVAADQAQLVKERAENQYPECPTQLAEVPK